MTELLDHHQLPHRRAPPLGIRLARRWAVHRVGHGKGQEFDIPELSASQLCGAADLDEGGAYRVRVMDLTYSRPS
jgi:hypothetical protein